MIFKLVLWPNDNKVIDVSSSPESACSKTLSSCVTKKKNQKRPRTDQRPRTGASDPPFFRDGPAIVWSRCLSGSSKNASKTWPWRSWMVTINHGHPDVRTFTLMHRNSPPPHVLHRTGQPKNPLRFIRPRLDDRDKAWPLLGQWRPTHVAGSGTPAPPRRPTSTHAPRDVTCSRRARTRRRKRRGESSSEAG